MQRYRKILHEKDLIDSSFIKSYLEREFRFSRTKKNKALYININIIFQKYPDTIKEILNNIPLLGYYKDYFYILMFSRNPELDQYIYNIIHTQLKEDQSNLKKNKKISTLGKWLPREDSKINKKCNFIDKFSEIFFPNSFDVYAARRKYRLMKTELNKELGTIESKLCTKQFSSINYAKVAPYALKKKMHIIQKHEESKIKYDEYQLALLKNMNLSELVREIIKNNSNDIEKVWNTFKSPFDKYLSNAVCIIDLSNDVYAVKGEFFAIGMALLASERFPNSRIFVGNEIVQLEDIRLTHEDSLERDLSYTLLNKIKMLQKYMGPCKFPDLSQFDDTQIIIVSTKEIKRPDRIKLLHIIPYYDTYTIKKPRKLIIPHNLARGTIHLQKNKIKMITNKSCELRDVKTPILIILFLWSVFLIIKFFPFFEKLIDELFRNTL